MTVLERLRIRDLALVDRAEVVLAPGLNVVTGETGAGKSLLVQSMSLLLGARADADAVREGADAARLEGEFRLEGEAARRVAALLGEWGIEFDGETLIVRREVREGGRSRATVNQSAVTQGALRRLGETLADFHGQHEHQTLLQEEAGLETLDRLGALHDLRDAYAAALAAHRAARDRLERLEASLATLEDRREWMRDTLAELREARLEEGEEERLALEAARLSHADRLRALAARALERLSEGEGSALDALSEAAHALSQAAALDPGLADTLPALEEARIAASDAARALAGYGASLEADPGRLEQVEARRETLARLRRRHRRDVTGLIAWRAELEAALEAGDDAEGAHARTRARESETRAACLEAGRALSHARSEAARAWGARLTRELKPLGMPHGRLEFEVGSGDGEDPSLGPHGLDRVEMRFGANPGEPSRPLRRIASGGELSRVTLALKAALETQDRVDLLVFDEVDSGIGGAVARAVGERLRSLSRHRQIVCVTHLPMIAALASHHVRVAKRVSQGRTLAGFETLAGEARVDELARMLAGDRVTGTTRRQARELLGAPGGRAVTR